MLRLSTLRSSCLTLALMSFALAGCSSESSGNRGATGLPRDPVAWNAPTNAVQTGASSDTMSDTNAFAPGRTTRSGSG